MYERACIVVLTLLLTAVLAVDRNNFKTCEQSSFCRRCRSMEEGKSKYVLHLNTVRLESTNLNAQLENTEYGIKFRFQLFSLIDNTFRMKITEWEGIKPRYEVQNILDGEPSLEKMDLVERGMESITVKSGLNKATIYSSPFRIDFFSGEQLVTSANARGLLRFEHTRLKQERNEGNEGNHSAPEEDPGAWEENFKSHHDTKPNGPTAVALDITFIGAQHAYGIPEHADAFALKSTKGGDPYRLYNLDVFEYELGNPMALYGSVPMLVAHGGTRTSGVFWLNSAETWIDIINTGDRNVVSSIVNFVSGTVSTPSVETHFMSESGIIDVFFFLGPQPKDVFRQYSKLTGTAPLPQYFALAYHQSRWNYNDQDDVRNVDNKFDEHDIPMDVMWLDIEHTDNKKYFTWDKIRFPNPTEMTQNLTAKGRKLVVIVDPHIKRDASYFLHNDAENNGFYVKTKDGKDFEGWCWPGSSSYLDVLNPTVQDYYSSRYLLSNYAGSTLDTYIWNDMNEPSVFNGPEITMHKDCIHHGGWEHRDVHNIYGFYYTWATYQGLIKRSDNKLRPFLLTRAFFAGSQRHAAVWTGDNTAEWGHLQYTIPMCLSLSVAGISFCGADVGGFFKNPDAELFTRWYQAAAFQPFFRAHSHIDTKRREPWLFDDKTTALVREAVRKRYSYLPLWYTLFYEHGRTGMPVMRPLWAEFPSDVTAFPIDNEYLLGNQLLVHPVTSSGLSHVSVYFPGKEEIWYDIDNYHPYAGATTQQIPVTMEKIPVFQKGGTIVPKKERMRRSSRLMHDDPYTLVVTLDKNLSASGTLYIDDGESFNYKQNQYLYLSLKYENKQLSSSYIDNNVFYPTKSWLERVVIVGVPPGITKASIQSKDSSDIELTFTYKSHTKELIVRKPAVSLAKEWTIVLQ